MNNRDSSEIVQYLADRAAIQEVLAAYFRGLDRCDRELVRNCFTEDIHVHYDKRAPVSGIDAMMAHLRTFARMEKGEMKVTTHFMGNLNVKYVRGDVAETETNAIAFMVEPADVMAMRSLRYIDRFRREGDGWRISDRLHTLDWSCRIPTTFGAPLAERVFTLPQRS